MPVATAEIPAAELARELEDFFAEHPQAAILEDGQVIFDMQSARYSLSSEQGRCLLHLWSEERNLVRTIRGPQVRKDSLRPWKRGVSVRHVPRCLSWSRIAIDARPLRARPRARSISAFWIACWCAVFSIGRPRAFAPPPTLRTALVRPTRATC